MLRILRSSDAVLVVSALAIAYCIWLIAKIGSVEEEVLDGVLVALDVPVYIEAEPDRKTVSIGVRYPKNLRKNIHSSAFRVLIKDPTLFAQPGVREREAVAVPLLADDVQRSSPVQSVQVQKVVPGRMTVWVKFRTVTARITPQFGGQPATGYRLEKTLVDQVERLVTGPQDRLDSLPRSDDAVVELQTGPISLTNRRDSFSTSAAIAVPEGLNLLDRETRQRLPRDASFAVVQVIIKEEVTTRTIAGVPIQVSTLARDLLARTDPSSGTVTIVGPRSRIESLDPRTIQLRPKSLPEESPGFTGEITIEARLDESVPPDVRIVGVRPETVVLRYETRAVEAKTTPTIAP